MLSKQATVQAIRCALASSGIELMKQDAFGQCRQRFSEHALRVSGAQAMSQAGVDTYLIQLFARHSSAAIYRYVQQAPLARQTSLSTMVAAGEPAKSAKMDTGVLDLGDLKQRLAELEVSAVQRPVAVLNPASQVLHKVLVWEPCLPLDRIRTTCAWFFAEQHHTLLVGDLPDVKRCEKCYPDSKVLHDSDTVDSSGSSSDSSA